MNVERFRKIFSGLEERFGYHVAEYNGSGVKKSGVSKTSIYAHTLEMWKSHLEGKKFSVKLKNGETLADSLGICPINKNSQCTWGAIDLDNYKPNLPELFKKLKSINVPVIPFRSKSGGVHIYIFMSEFVSAILMREKLHSIKNIFGVEKPDKIFPVQKYLNLEKGSAGSWINIPYHNAANTERYMILEDGQKATLEQFFEAYEKSKITPNQLKKLKSNIDEGKGGEWFKDGPPCLQAVATFGIEEGNRNDTLIDMTRYIKMRFPENWEKKTRTYNEEFLEPKGEGLPDKEVTSIINSREKKDYAYRCNSPHLKQHCDPGACILRKFGVKSKKGLPTMALGPLNYLKSKPKVWFLGFDGDEVRLSSEQLTKQDLARIAATEQTARTPPRMKLPDWDTAIAELQKKAVGLEAPQESLPDYQLRNFVENYCFNLRRTTNIKLLLLGRPFHQEKEGAVHFMFKPFYKHLKNNDWKSGETETHEMLQHMKGLLHQKIHIDKGVKRWVYTIDVSIFKVEEEVEQDNINFEPEDTSQE